MKKHFFILIIIAFCKSISFSQQIINSSSAEMAGLSSKKLQKLDKALAMWVDKGWTNGGAAIVVKNGKVAYHKAFGFNDLQTKKLFKKDDIFRIASQTKACMGSFVLPFSIMSCFNLS